MQFNVEKRVFEPSGDDRQVVDILGTVPECDADALLRAITSKFDQILDIDPNVFTDDRTRQEITETKNRAIDLLFAMKEVTLPHAAANGIAQAEVFLKLEG